MLLAGCGGGNDEIRRYQVEKVKPPEFRMLGAIVPQNGGAWFVKMMGPVESVEDYQDSFHTFLDSIRFTERPGKPIRWQKPEDWREKDDKDSKFVYAAFEVGRPRDRVELTVSAAGGSVLANINRWRGQLSQEAITEEELSAHTKSRKVDGIEALLVDIRGPKSKQRMQPPLAGGAPARTTPADATPRLAYDMPGGWTKGPPVAMSVATYSVSEGDQTATVTVTPLGGDAGGLLPNVNRWRRQVGLEPIDEKELVELAELRKIDGGNSLMVELVGPEAEDTPGRSILAAVTFRRDRAWFFKMVGPSALVSSQKENFGVFLDSVRFETDG